MSAEFTWRVETREPNGPRYTLKPMSKMEWTKEKQEDGDNYYKCGRFSIQPIIGDSYYKWFMNGIPAGHKSRYVFTTLSAAKNYAQQIMDELEPA